MKKNSGYMTRALRHRDPRFARILGRLGYEGRDMRPAVEQEPADDIASVREEYERVVGKRPFMGWDIETLRAKMAEAKA
ncbi:hypothetical protein JI664_12700 [Rhodobacter sp. NTK016B]|uniref:hypothetical protein n=1 Tax=Rhodobacter sp. NTK016B TaxID=2759676 RepID=UPI001A8C8C2A|nr:hypothetical protein [Rhodobacter sp. NTK016B]MBN8292826.1 hypothetical protein [Rhodobacter sp. NTK016B]